MQALSTGSFTQYIRKSVLHLPQCSTYSSKTRPCLCSIREKGTIWIHLPPTFPSHKWQCQKGEDLLSSPKQWPSDYLHQIPTDTVLMFYPVTGSNFPWNPRCTLSSTSPGIQQGYEVHDCKISTSQISGPKLLLCVPEHAWKQETMTVLNFPIKVHITGVSSWASIATYKVYVAPIHTMKCIFIILNLGTRWTVVILEMRPFYVPHTSFLKNVRQR